MISSGISIPVSSLSSSVLGSHPDAQSQGGSQGNGNSGLASLFSQLLAGLSESEASTDPTPATPSKPPKQSADDGNPNAQNVLLTAVPAQVPIQQPPLGFGDLLGFLTSDKNPVTSNQSETAQSSETAQPSQVGQQSDAAPQQTALQQSVIAQQLPAIQQSASNVLATQSAPRSQPATPGKLQLRPQFINASKFTAQQAAPVHQPIDHQPAITGQTLAAGKDDRQSLIEQQSPQQNTNPVASPQPVPQSDGQSINTQQPVAAPQIIVPQQAAEGPAQGVKSQPAATPVVEAPSPVATPAQPTQTDVSADLPANPVRESASSPEPNASRPAVKATGKKSSSPPPPNTPFRNPLEGFFTPLIAAQQRSIAPAAASNNQSNSSAIAPAATPQASSTNNAAQSGSAPALPATNATTTPVDNFAFAMRVTPDSNNPSTPKTQSEPVSAAKPADPVPDQARPQPSASKIATATEAAAKPSALQPPALSETSSITSSQLSATSEPASSSSAKATEPPPNPASTHLDAKLDVPQQHEPVRNVQMQLAGDNNQRVNVRLTETGGELRVSVKASDPVLAQTLQDHMPELTTRLGQQQYRTEVWTPRESSGTQSNTSSSGGYTSGGDANQGRRQNGQQQNQPSWLDELDDNPGPSQSARRNSTWQQ